MQFGRWIVVSLPVPVLAMASACSFAPAHQRPALPVAPSYPAAASDAPSVAHVGWRDFFRDEQLRALIAQALETNRDIRQAAARVAQARAAWRIDGAALYPQLNAIGIGARGSAAIDLPEVGTQDYQIKQVAGVLSASWELDFWGRLRNQKASSRDRYLASEEARRALATELIAQVANGYLLEREYAEREALARRTIATREESLRILRRRYEVGSGSRLEMTQAQTLLAQAQMALHALAQDRGVNHDALELLVGRALEIPAGPLTPVAGAPDVAIPTGLPSALLDNRPDIVAAEYQLRATEADIGAARAAFFPNIDLTGSFGTGSSDLAGLFQPGSRTWIFAPSITMPLFNAGRLKANLALARARQSEAVAAYEQTVQQAFRDVSDALVRRRELAFQIESAGTMLEALRERARLAQLRFENGRSAYLEVLDAQRDLFDTEQSLVQLRRAHLASGVALYAALGGGFAGEPAFDTGAAHSQPSGAPQQ